MDSEIQWSIACSCSLHSRFETSSEPDTDTNNEQPGPGSAKGSGSGNGAAKKLKRRKRAKKKDRRLVLKQCVKRRRGGVILLCYVRIIWDTGYRIQLIYHIHNQNHTDILVVY